MRIANVNGRAVILTADDRGVDFERISGGRFGPQLTSVYDNWEDFRAWATGIEIADEITFTRDQLGSPSPAPRQIFASGLNYGGHIAEAGMDAFDTFPPTFTKFLSSMSGPDVEVVLPPGNVDWEVELVVVIGRTGKNIAVGDAWSHVAGVTIGQDYSERASQLAGPYPQFSLAKSFPNFAPVGPWLVTADELPDKDDLALGCSIDGETVQDGRTSGMNFSVPRLISHISHIVTLYPGDILFTGTPDGVGYARTPPRWLKPGEELISWIEGVGTMRQTFVA